MEIIHDKNKQNSTSINTNSSNILRLPNVSNGGVLSKILNLLRDALQYLILIPVLYICVQTLVLNTAKAQTVYRSLYSQTSYASSTGNSNVGGSNNFWYQNLGTGLSGTFNRILVKETAGYSALKLQLIHCSSLPAVTDWGSSCPGLTTDISATTTTQTSGGYRIWEFQTNYEFTYPGMYYVLLFWGSDTNTVNFWGSQDVNSYANGECKRYVSPSMTTCPNNIKDLNFYIQSTYTGTGIDTQVSLDDNTLAGLDTALGALTLQYSDCSAYEDTPFFSTSTLGQINCFARNAGKAVLNKLIAPASSSIIVSFLNDSVNGLAEVFPFNIWIGFLNTVKNEADDYTTTDPSLTITLPSPLRGTFTFSSTTMNTALGSSTYATITTYAEHSIWFLLGISILATLFL